MGYRFMDALTALGLIAIIWLAIYFIAQYLGVERLQEKGVEAGTPFFFMWKTERLNAFLTKMGKKFPVIFFNVGIVVGFGGIVLPSVFPRIHTTRCIYRVVGPGGILFPRISYPKHTTRCIYRVVGPGGIVFPGISYRCPNNT